MHIVNGLALGLPALQAALHGLGHGHGLGDAEADGTVDGDAPIGALLQSGNVGGGHGHLDENVLIQRGQLGGVGHGLFRAAVEAGVYLHGLPALDAAALPEHGQQHVGALQGGLLGQGPADLLIRGVGHFHMDQGIEPILPIGHLLAQNVAHDDGVGGGAGGAVTQGQIQIRHAAGVVPKQRLGEALRRLLQRAFIGFHDVCSPFP